MLVSNESTRSFERLININIWKYLFDFNGMLYSYGFVGSWSFNTLYKLCIYIYMSWYIAYSYRCIFTSIWSEPPGWTSARRPSPKLVPSQRWRWAPQRCFIGGGDCGEWWVMGKNAVFFLFVLCDSFGEQRKYYIEYKPGSNVFEPWYMRLCSYVFVQ